MHLRSLSLKGFKSFPDRTRLEFGPGVSVVVGPNGSGKSNITDAVLWALGEQSPLAVRGQAMQDVIFSGGHGRTGARAAEVELVIDNGDRALDVDFTEISIVRRLDRSGEGEYRLNGARCRLVDVMELLSDTGLGKETHSVVSQGRVEAIVTSKPKDRRLLIEEAAGLAKHRKRRRRAQLKLERTQDNLDRALDVEREARSRLRPLKRQAEAAELHERLERQTLEARWALAREALRAAQAEQAAREAAAAEARGAAAESERRLAAVAARREAAEEALASRAEERETLSRRVERARSVADRVGFRLETVRGIERQLADRVARRRGELGRLRAEADADRPDEGAEARIAALEAERARLAEDREAERRRELEALAAERDAAARLLAEADAAVAARQAARTEADAAAEAARAGRREAERAVEAARREAARVGADLAAANGFLRRHAGAPGGARALADDLGVDPGLELALAAALGDRLRAAVVDDRPGGAALLDRAGRDGGVALVGPAGDAAEAAGAGAAPGTAPPVAGAERLLDHVRAPERLSPLLRALLADTWLVGDLAILPGSFRGTAVTRAGRVWAGATGELRQAPVGGEDRVLAERNRRDALIRESEAAAAAEATARHRAEATGAGVAEADAARDAADAAARAARRERDEAADAVRAVDARIARRRQAPDEGELAQRARQLESELAAERRLAERAARERAERERRLAHLTAGVAADEALVPQAARLATALTDAEAAARERVVVVERELAADRAAGERLAADLRACASEEAQVQAELRRRSEAVTAAEVAAQRVRDRTTEAGAELRGLAEPLGLAPEPAEAPLPDEEREALEARLARLARRREQLGPVNPLAKAEYDEALAHVEELETQRGDLETALRELTTLIRDTDRQIRETFEETFAAAARNFEELAARLFPGGKGRLRLVREEGPRPVLGGAAADGDGEAAPDGTTPGDATDGEPAEEEPGAGPDEAYGVEIEITPAGKSMRRLSLLSGGEKSMTALAFLFSVFLARPCPFYILDEVEAALDDLNIDRFIALVREYSDRAQFIVVTHQKRTMEAADWLYGVSMGGDGVSKVVSRRLPREVAPAPPPVAEPLAAG